MSLKKFIPIAIALYSLYFVSCKDELDKLTQFTISQQSEFSVPSTTVVDIPLSVPTPEVSVDSQQEFENNNSRRDLIENARLRKLVLSIKSPDTGNFDFLNEIEIYIEADGLDRVLIASLDAIPETQLKTIELDVASTELVSYLRKDSYTLIYNVKVDQTIETEYVIEANSDIFIDAEILGI